MHSTTGSTNKYCYIMGDFSINLLNVDSHIPTAEFSEIIFSHYCMPLINKPTRVKSGSVTFSDDIFTNKMSDNAYQGIMFTDITDHFPIFYINVNCKLETVTVSDDKILDDNIEETAFSTFHGMFKSIGPI